MDDEFTCKCGKESPGYHWCPYQEEILDNDSEDHCNCCNDCMHECAMDI